MTNQKQNNTTTLFRQLIKSHLIIAFLVLFISTLTSIGFDIFIFSKSIDQNLTSTANILVRIVEPALMFMDKAEATKSLSLLKSEPTVTAAELYDSTGKPYATYGSPIHLNSDVSTLLSAKRGKTIISGKNIYHIRPILQDNNTLGLLVISSSISVFLTNHLKYLWIFGAVIVVISVLASLLSRLASTLISNPIKAASNAVRKITATGSYSVRISNSEGAVKISEIDILASDFNKMIDHIQMKEEEILLAKNELERKVEQRTGELRISQKIALENAHAAGMSEIATGVLHNVGNIMNSINISVIELETSLQNSKFSSLEKGLQILSENKNNLLTFFTEDQKGKSLPEYLIKLGSILSKEQSKIKEEVTQISAKLKIIESVVQTQQEYAGKSLFAENLPVCEMIDEILKLSKSSLAKHKIQIEKNYNENIILNVQKVKFAHVMVNLIKNAKEAMYSTAPDNRVLKVTVGRKSEIGNYISISDTGEGIESENLGKIFGHGFTTKKAGHGFGLHFCANAMTEMGGRMLVESAGAGRGATFTLLFQDHP